MPTDSNTIFDTKPQADVRHDIGTVQEKWSAEQRRRTKKALLILLPIFLVLLPTFLTLSYNIPGFPLHDTMHGIGGGGCCGSGDDHGHDHDHDEEAQKHQPKVEVNPADAKPGMGFVDAKVVITVAPEYAPSSIMNILYDAVGSKPSEIRVNYIVGDMVTKDMENDMRTKETCAMTINNMTKVDVVVNGQPKSIFLDGPAGVAYTADDLAEAIMKVHEDVYGKPQHPVFVPYVDGKQLTGKELEEFKRKREEPVKIIEPETQTFDTLPTIREAPAPR